MAARAKMKKFRVWHWVWRERAFEIRRAKDEATLREKLPRRLADRLIEIEELDAEEKEEPEIQTLPIGTEVILASGAHGFVFGHFRREDGSTWLRVTHPDYWAQRRKWDVTKFGNYPPAWDCVAQSSVTVATSTKFSIGEKVRVVSEKTDSMHHKGYEEFLWKVVTIRRAFNNPNTCGDYYYLEERIDWTWTNDMFESV